MTTADDAAATVTRRATPRTAAMRVALQLSGKPREEIELERSLITGIAAFRWVTWVWMAVVLTIDVRQSPSMARTGLGVALVAAALAWTLAASVLVRVGPSMLLDRWALAIELAIAAALVFSDWAVYGADNAHSQSLGSAWPLAVLFTMGIVYGGPLGFFTGVGLGIVRVAGAVIFQFELDESRIPGDDRVAAIGTIVFYALAGGVAGFVATRLRQAEREIAIARAREEVGRTLHDGVLQTLAIVQRRSTDGELVELAREQEQDLREFLYGTKPDTKQLFRPATTDVHAALREVANDAERRHRIRSQVVVTDEPPPLPDAVAAAICGAVAEALTNAAKHGGAATATIFLEPDAPAPDGTAGGAGRRREQGHIFCSVKDDGSGFDPDAVAEGIGTTKSIRGRITDIGGTVEIDGRPGRGTEVRLWVPL